MNNASGLMLSVLIKSTTLKQTNVLFKKRKSSPPLTRTFGKIPTIILVIVYTLKILGVS